ncbi:hypothetical protein TRFO_19650 [Tritrichomonas foetus]|uniref:Uncharacterized protein n=1 Tax=Tritrichomonas foetus TaxID=1144522 RepID=A0A1J4KI99_9EUKA|nr:hypothetical protein TRFO_19650 [Tritrichomonas foetus]|eukprot:OHT10947.1 hypothetical protein TRFO_19650 [Tritrichomonas foetus]
MNQTLDRRIEQFQNKVQQKINLADDQIQRDNEYLNSLQVEIVEATDKLRNLDNQVEQRQQVVIGKHQRKKVSQGMQIAKLKSSHALTIKELEATLAEEIETLHQDFQNTLVEIQKSIPKRISEKIAPVEIEIKKVQDLISKKLESNSKIEQAVDADSEADIEQTHDMEFNRIKKLETRLQEKNQERLNSLLQARQQLFECVHTLEEMEQTHNVTMDNFKDQLIQMDEKYESQVKRETENHKKQTVQVKQKIKEMEQIIKALTKSLHRTEKRQKEALSSLSIQTESLQQELLTIKKQEAIQREGENDIKEVFTKLTSLKKQLSDRENILLKMRADNEMMKREIARVTHEAKIAKRREALKIV